MDLDRSANEGPGSRRSGYSDRRVRWPEKRVGGIGRNAFAGGSSGGCWFWPGGIVPVPLPQSERTFA